MDGTKVRRRVKQKHNINVSFFLLKKKVFFAENCKSQGLLWLLGSSAQSAVDMFTLSYIHSTSTLAYQALKSISSIVWPLNFIWASKTLGKAELKVTFFHKVWCIFLIAQKMCRKLSWKRDFEIAFCLESAD